MGTIDPQGAGRSNPLFQQSKHAFEMLKVATGEMSPRETEYFRAAQSFANELANNPGYGAGLSTGLFLQVAFTLAGARDQYEANLSVTGSTEELSAQWTNEVRNFKQLNEVTVKRTTKNAAVSNHNGNAQAGVDGQSEWKGPVDYTVLPEARNVGPDKPFTKMQHKNAIEHNKKMNGEVIRDDVDGSILNAPKQDKRGVKSDMNSAQLDHKMARKPKDKTQPAGTNSNSNISIRFKRANIKKSNN